MNQPKIRFATVKELDTIRKLDPHSEYIDRERIRSKIIHQEIIVAETNKVIGLLKFSYFWCTRPYIDLIYIAPQFRGKGLSRLLLDYLVNYLTELGYSYLFSSSEEKDDKARSWHLYHNFKPMGTLTDLNLPHDSTHEIFYSLKIGNALDIPKYQL